VQGALPTDVKGASGFGVMKGPTPGGQERYNTGGRNMVLNAQKPQATPVKENAPQMQSIPTTESLDNQNEVKDDSEEARIQAMFQQTTDQWGAMQERLAE
jgi:protein MPE1